MKEIKSASLVYFKPGCEEHMQILRKNKGYNFQKDLHLIKELLESTEFNGSVDINENDYIKYVVEDTFLIGIEIIDDIDLESYKYLFDAFNVYYSQNNTTYVQDPALSAAWRKIMKNVYPDSSYSQDCKQFLRKEMQENIDSIINNYSDQIDNL